MRSGRGRGEMESRGKKDKMCVMCERARVKWREVVGG